MVYRKGQNGGVSPATRITPAVFVVFMQNEVDEGIASTATINQLTYSKRNCSSLLLGFNAPPMVIA